MRHSTCQFVATSAIWVLALFGTGGVPHSAEAALIVVNSRSAFDALGQVTSVDWGVFGAGGTSISTPAFETVGPLTVGVTSSQGVLARKDEGTQFIGNFTVGDHLLTDGNSKSDSFIVSFGAPVVGFGTQIEPDYIRGAFTGDIRSSRQPMFCSETSRSAAMQGTLKTTRPRSTALYPAVRI